MQGPSMAPALRHGDQVLAWLRPPRRLRPGDVLVVELPERGLAVKRLRELRTDGTVWIEGDNPAGSTDSRQLGPVAAGAVRGRVLARVWPRPGRV